ncbi:MAG: hypothetical protein ACRD2D_11460, partial [Terriglobales bacterium]
VSLGAWALFPADWTAIGWAALLLGAAAGVRRLRDNSLRLQACALAAAVMLRAAIVNAHFGQPFPHHIAVRILSLPLLALAFYGTHWLLDESHAVSCVLRSVSLWAGTALIAALALVELPTLWIAPAWTALAVGLCLAGRRFRLAEFNFQEYLLAPAAVIALFGLNLQAAHALNRYLPLIGCAAAFYAVSRFSTQVHASYRQPVAWIHTWTATALLAALAWHESPQPWLAVAWILFAFALALADRVFTVPVEELPWQAHFLALLAAGRAATSNFFITGKLHGFDLRLLTVAVVIAALYGLARWVRLPQRLETASARHAYTWVGSGFAAWLLWCELPPISVALGVGVFALLLFEVGVARGQMQLRFQSYALLAASFLRIFLVNLSAVSGPGELISPRIYTVVPLALIFFYVWARLARTTRQPESGRWYASTLVAYFGTGSVVALLYFQLSSQWIVAGWALVVVGLTGAALWLGEEVFLEQTALLSVATVARGLAHNVFGSSYFSSGAWRGSLFVLALTSLLLLAALPMAFRIRSRYADRPSRSWLGRGLAAHRPDQMLFFAPILLIVVAIAARMAPGAVTLAWTIIGLLAIALGLAAAQRSYRLTGLALLV